MRSSAAGGTFSLAASCAREYRPAVTYSPWNPSGCLAGTLDTASSHGLENTDTSYRPTLRYWTPMMGNGPPAWTTRAVASATVRLQFATHRDTPSRMPPAMSALTTGVTADRLM